MEFLRDGKALQQQQSTHLGSRPAFATPKAISGAAFSGANMNKKAWHAVRCRILRWVRNWMLLWPALPETGDREHKIVQGSAGGPRFYNPLTLVPLSGGEEVSSLLLTHTTAQDHGEPFPERVRRAFAHLRQHSPEWSMAALQYWTLWLAFKDGWASRPSILVRSPPFCRRACQLWPLRFCKCPLQHSNPARLRRLWCCLQVPVQIEGFAAQYRQFLLQPHIHRHFKEHLMMLVRAHLIAAWHVFHCLEIVKGGMFVLPEASVKVEPMVLEDVAVLSKRLQALGGSGSQPGNAGEA